MNRFLSALLALCLCLPVSAFGAGPAGEGTSVNTKRALLVGKSAAYGFGGGLVVGLASQVFKRETKNIFLFGSLGLYAGILLGVYIISSSRGPMPYDGPDTYEDYGDFSLRSRPERSAPGMVARTEPSVGFNIVNVSF